MKKMILALCLGAFTLGVNAQEKKQNPVPYTSSIKTGDLLYISGQVGINPTTSTLASESFEIETKQVMENLKSELAKHGLTMDDIVSTIIYLKDMDHYQRLNQVYGSFFSERFPTRTCIAVANLPANASVEISAVAEFKNKK
ncbi:RidA family protein [Myroides sp. LJL116]